MVFLCKLTLSLRKKETIHKGDFHEMNNLQYSVNRQMKLISVRLNPHPTPLEFQCHHLSVHILVKNQFVNRNWLKSPGNHKHVLHCLPFILTQIYQVLLKPTVRNGSCSTLIFSTSQQKLHSGLIRLFQRLQAILETCLYVIILHRHQCLTADQLHCQI